jgi:hypothetical protein
MDPLNTAERLQKETIYFELHTNVLGVNRKISTNNFRDDLDADRDLLRASKVILECEELKAVKSVVTAARAFYQSPRGIAIPRSHLAKGCYCIPLKSFSIAEEKYKEFLAAFNEAVDRFIAAYPRLLQNAKEKLGALWDAGDYPPTDTLKNFFRFYRFYSDVEAPADKLRGVGTQEQLDQIVRDNMVALQAEAKTIRDALRVAFAELVEHLTDRLAPDVAGKPKRLFASSVDNLKEFVDTFEVKNLTDDGEFASLVKKAKAILSGVDPQDLRSVDSVRESVSKGLDEIKQAIKTFDLPQKRAISLTDEAV